MKWSWQLGCPCDPQLARAILDLEQTAWRRTIGQALPVRAGNLRRIVVAFEDSRAVEHCRPQKGICAPGVSYTGYGGWRSGRPSSVAAPRWKRNDPARGGFRLSPARRTSLFTCEPSRVSSTSAADGARRRTPASSAAPASARFRRPARTHRHGALFLQPGNLLGRL